MFCVSEGEAVLPSNRPHEDVYVAIRNAFRAARRQLETHFRTIGALAAG